MHFLKTIACIALVWTTISVVCAAGFVLFRQIYLRTYSVFQKIRMKQYEEILEKDSADLPIPLLQQSKNELAVEASHESITENTALPLAFHSRKVKIEKTTEI